MNRPITSGRRRARAVLLLAGAAFVAIAGACGDDPLSPRQVEGAYHLIGRQPVDPLADYLPLITDTLVFAAGGDGVQVVRHTEWTTAGPQERRRTWPFGWRVKGHTVLVGYRDPMLVAPTGDVGIGTAGSGAPLEPPARARPTTMTPGPHLRGKVTSRGLVLTSTGGDTLFYERVRGTP